MKRNKEIIHLYNIQLHEMIQFFLFDERNRMNI